MNFGNLNTYRNLFLCSPAEMVLAYGTTICTLSLKKKELLLFHIFTTILYKEIDKKEEMIKSMRVALDIYSQDEVQGFYVHWQNRRKEYLEGLGQQLIYKRRDNLQ